VSAVDAAYLVVTVVAAAANGYAAVMDATRPAWLLDNMARLSVPRTQLGPLGAAKAAGAAGLVVGIAVPAVGVVAAAGLTLFFAGAVVTVVRSGWLGHLPYPATYLALSAASLALRLATA
jgi:hypothetical protein